MLLCCQLPAPSLPGSPHCTAPCFHPGFRYILWPWVSPSGQGLPVLAPSLRASLSLYQAQLIITLT